VPRARARELGPGYNARVKRALCAAVVLTAAAAACSSSQRAEPRTRLSTRDILDRNKPAIVRVESRVGDGDSAQVGFGTGFVVGGDGRIVTNLHVIAGSADVNVRLADDRIFPVISVLAVDEKRDLAIIGINAQGLTTVKLGDSDQVSAGDRVVAIGNPLGVLDYTVSDGLISSLRPLNDELTLLQISAPISQGSSGGPLFNPYGEVIGVAVGVSREGQNLNFGIPSNYLRPLVATVGAGESMAEFAARTRREAGAGPHRPGSREALPQKPPIERPKHELSLLDGCSPEQIVQVAQGITEAIAIGAPVYNLGQYEACFVIYRKAAETFQKDEAMCGGIRGAFQHGLGQAQALDDDHAKAWALRYTFDALLDVIERKLRGSR
jgi:serine protease Do